MGGEGGGVWNIRCPLITETTGRIWRTFGNHLASTFLFSRDLKPQPWRDRCRTSSQDIGQRILLHVLLNLTSSRPCARGPRNQSAYLEGLMIPLQSPAAIPAGRKTRHTKHDLEVGGFKACRWDILRVQTDCNLREVIHSLYRNEFPKVQLYSSSISVAGPNVWEKQH